MSFHTKRSGLVNVDSPIANDIFIENALVIKYQKTHTTHAKVYNHLTAVSIQRSAQESKTWIQSSYFVNQNM